MEPKKVSAVVAGNEEQGRAPRNISISCNNIVIATDAPAAQTLLAAQADKLGPVPVGRSSLCVYFAIDGAPPLLDAVLLLNGENKMSSSGKDKNELIINNVCFPSQVGNKSMY